MLMQAYFDESGHSANTNSIAVAGLAAFEYQWDGFDEEWNAALASAGVAVFHMTDFENRKKAFVGWDEHTQKRPLIAQLLQIITRRKLVAVGTAVSVPFFESIPPDEYEDNDFFEDPYHLALEETIHLLGGEVGPDFKATAVSVTLADQPEFKRQGRGYYAGSAALLYPWYLWPHAPYVSVAESARLQAADIVAYELRKACDDPPARRWPMQQIRTTPHCFLVKGLDGSKIFGSGVSQKKTEYFVLKVKR
jgi:hypothetical protein